MDLCFSQQNFSIQNWTKFFGINLFLITESLRKYNFEIHAGALL